MSPAAESVIHRLDGARQRWWLFSLLTTTVLAACASFAAIQALMLIDAFLRLSQPWLLAMLLAWLALSGVLVFAVAKRLLRGERSLEAAARRVEIEFPELGSSLINLVQLSEDSQHANPAFREAAVRQAASQIGGLSFDQAPARESRWRRLVHRMQTPRDLAESLGVLALLIVIAVVCQMLVPSWGSAASRLLAPWTFVPAVGSVKITRVTPGNTEVLIGDSVEIVAEIENPAKEPHRAWLFVAADDQPETRMAMAADKKCRRYTATVSAILKPCRYRLEIGDSQTQVYTIGVRQKPAIESVELTLHYPAYLGRKDETLRQQGLDIEAPQYSVAEMRLRMATPVARGHLESGSQQFSGHVSDDGRLVTATMPLLANGSYCVRLFNDAGHNDRNPRQNRVTVIADAPPTVELLKPGRQTTASPGANIDVLIRAGDDHGVGRLQLQMKVVQPDADSGEVEQAKPAGKEKEGDVTVVKQWADFADNATAVAGEYRLELKPDAVKPGQTVLLRAVAWDRRVVNSCGLDLKPRETAGAWHAVKIVAKEAEAASSLEQLDRLRRAIFELLQKQIHSRASAGAIAKSSPVPKGEGTAAVKDVRSKQIEIQKKTDELARSIAPSEHKERLTIKRVLNGLAFGEMIEAVAQCDALLKADGPPKRLLAAQDRIIDVLRRLLDVTRQAEAEALADMKKRPGGDLPDDAKSKLEEIRKKLDEFLKQQKKVIEASESLAKTPVEDFTAKEQELLKGMAATEDDWAKFMKDLHSDLSKLPEQDFANASMAKELAEIQTELKMAEDALLKKSVDIAVPLEQLGYEMAEELKTNIEKWLPDTPDREKWSQEESLTDKDKEAPMAELPHELEDLVGDLMEKEEDLFDEMEDITSSAADSLDKGAGWDALDGPISNMSAKGVTGNRLPNKSEIGGRSGEGRQGKSSGEFVGDEAVGKGGRKTPSRLTPDPFVKGQIKDHSKQSPGGATGGGKESGKGGEGLEGPQAKNPGPRNAERLAGRQAALRNKAEGIDLRFQVAKFHHTDLKKLIELMAQVERDLKAGRYQNAQRQRHVLVDGLGRVKQYLRGEFEVRKDTTANLPADIQKEILGSMQDASPAGWEELNRQYFERLSKGEGAGAGEGSGRPGNAK
jgi:hypothetical protein